MYISKLELRNIRGVGARGLVLDLARTGSPSHSSHAGWTVIAGSNGAGKTTLLQAMAATLLGGTGTNWLFRPEDRRDWIYQRGRKAALSDLGTTCAWIERVPSDDDAAPREQTVAPVPLRVVWPRDHSWVRELPPEGEHSTLLHQFWNAAAWGTTPAGWMFAAYGPHRSNRQSSPDSASLLRGPPRSAAVVTLFRQDAGLEGVNGWLIDLELRAARRQGAAAAAVRDGVLRLLGDGLVEANKRTQLKVEADGLHVRWGAGWRPIRQLGDGFYSTLVMVADILMRVDQFRPGRLLEEIQTWPSTPDFIPALNMSGVVVIDEPEGHLHPDLQQRLGFWLKQHFPKLQFIVTTHSPLICQAAEPGGLFRMPKTGAIEAVDSETWARVVNGTLDTSVTSHLFDLKSAESDRAAKQRRRLAELMIKWRREGLSPDEQAEQQGLSARLPTEPSYQLDTLVQGLLRL
ncbi:MAG: AAA family ATPase [Deltaproteobacteria bacterium]|nr:AAA family ATPase [Deltaproteobacteria bacterium]